LTLASFEPEAYFTLIDVNERALELCKKNIKSLNLNNVTCLQSDVYQNVQGLFNSIVINPPIRAGKKVIYSMFAGAYDHLIDGGSLFIVIRKSHGAHSACDYITSIFGSCTLLKKDKGYYIYESKKMNKENL
jgi:16S rRNA (guanine1207-N2)-methyltransferase